MHIIENRISPKEPVIPNIFRPYFADCKLTALDIETTGLSKDRSQVILIGVLSKDEDGFLVTQFFADHPEEEPEILANFLDFIKDQDVLFNYNGTSFDIPFLNTRIEKFQLSSRIPLCKSFDLYRIVRSSFLSEFLPDLKLKTVEKLAGVHREDQISGKDSVQLYKKYVSTQDKALARKILLHNYEDLICFTSFATLIKKIDFHRSVQKHGFPIKTKFFTFYPDTIQFRDGKLDASGTVFPQGLEASYFLEDQTLLIDRKKGSFSFSSFVDLPSKGKDARETNFTLMDALKTFPF